MRTYRAVSMILVGLITGLILSSALDVQRLSFAEDTGVAPGAAEFLGKFNDSLSQVADSVKPSVVNISTTKIINQRGNPFGGIPDDPFFRRFFGSSFDRFGQKQKFKATALGSGVIITKDGYILTNNHVVKDADEIKVILFDKREFKGKIIGKDPKTDLAVIKIDAEGLPAIRIGDSDKLRVGSLVIAIGNPFALSHTITMGIVSAVGRSNVGIADYEDFIQTDAAINPGNSGGALVNIKGELVGINTAIFSNNGGYMGIGFAIPSSMTNYVVESIIQHGKVIRGWLGVSIQDLTSELAKHFNIIEEKGSIVTDIVKDSPAEKAGLERGDLIIGINGEQAETSTALRNMVANVAPGETAKIKIIREGKVLTLKATIGEFKESVTTARSEYGNAMRGIHVQDLTPGIKDSMNIPQSVQGVLVTNIENDSPARGVLRPRDIIKEINRKGVMNSEDYDNIASHITARDSVMLLVIRSGVYIYVTFS